MRFEELLFEAPIAAISPQQAADGKMFGPIYHGTKADISNILQTGFNVKYSVPSSINNLYNRPTGENAHGMPLAAYAANGIAPPVHWLGFGIYGTTVKAISKRFAGDTMKGMKTFYLDSERVLEINFGAPNTMMKWWLQNGYDMTAEATKNRDFSAWIKATGNLTRQLRKDYDAVWFKGKSARGPLLDGDQICIYRPKLIRVLEPKLASGLEVGAKVYHTQNYTLGRNDIYIDTIKPDDRYYNQLAGWKGVFRALDHDGNDLPRSASMPIHQIPPPNMVGTIVAKRPIAADFRHHHGGEDALYDVKWAKGGVRHNYRPSELRPAKT